MGQGTPLPTGLIRIEGEHQFPNLPKPLPSPARDSKDGHHPESTGRHQGSRIKGALTDMDRPISMAQGHPVEVALGARQMIMAQFPRNTIGSYRSSIEVDQPALRIGMRKDQPAMLPLPHRPAGGSPMRPLAIRGIPDPQGTSQIQGDAPPGQVALTHAPGKGFLVAFKQDIQVRKRLSSPRGLILQGTRTGREPPCSDALHVR